MVESTIGLSAKAKHLQRTLQDLLDNQPDDFELREQLQGMRLDEALPGLTWFWGPELYRRNRDVFRKFILTHFSVYEREGRPSWRPVPWNEHGERLDDWLTATRRHQDVRLTRELLRWKFAKHPSRVDSAAFRKELLREYQAADGPAAQAVILKEFDVWFELDEPTALALYSINRACSKFLLRRPPTRYDWVDSEKRELWRAMFNAALAANDDKLAFTLYRRQVAVKEWQRDVLRLAKDIADPAELCDELCKRHPEGGALKLAEGVVLLLRRRGRDVMPYVREKLSTIVRGWSRESPASLLRLARERGWWDLWAATVRMGDPRFFNKEVGGLLDDATLDEESRIERLKALAGVSGEWNWPGQRLEMVQFLQDDVATRLYWRYPGLVHGPFKPHIVPTWEDEGRGLLDAAHEAGDDELVDLPASRYVTKVAFCLPVVGTAGQGTTPKIVADLTAWFETLRERDAAMFARRAANILTQLPPSSIHGYDQLMWRNDLAWLLFVRTFSAFLSVPEAVRDLVEGSEVHVRVLGYRVLAQDDDQARRLAVESLETLQGTLLQPLHRKSRLAAFGALANAARGDAAAAARVLKRAREALRLPDKKYPKEELVGLIGTILHERPELRGSRERPVVYGLEEVGA